MFILSVFDRIKCSKYLKVHVIIIIPIAQYSSIVDSLFVDTLLFFKPCESYWKLLRQLKYFPFRVTIFDENTQKQERNLKTNN